MGNRDKVEQWILGPNFFWERVGTWDTNCCVKNLILGKLIIFKQSNSELRVNFMNRTIAK